MKITSDNKSQYNPYLNIQKLIKPYLNCRNYLQWERESVGVGQAIPIPFVDYRKLTSRLTTWSNAAPPPSFKGSSLGACDNFDNLDCKTQQQRQHVMIEWNKRKKILRR